MRFAPKIFLAVAEFVFCLTALGCAGPNRGNQAQELNDAIPIAVTALDRTRRDLLVSCMKEQGLTLPSQSGRSITFFATSDEVPSRFLLALSDSELLERINWIRKPPTPPTAQQEYARSGKASVGGTTYQGGCDAFAQKTLLSQQPVFAVVEKYMAGSRKTQSSASPETGRSEQDWFGCLSPDIRAFAKKKDLKRPSELSGFLGLESMTILRRSANVKVLRSSLSEVVDDHEAIAAELKRCRSRVSARVLKAEYEADLQTMAETLTEAEKRLLLRYAARASS